MWLRYPEVLVASLLELRLKKVPIPRRNSANFQQRFDLDLPILR